ncbi:phosphoribosylglycinamide formyltransferase [Neptunicella sp. SCSIO 80796]|uniref:phosphoribosylglycinamide formyltransferase n=1 Tax=Neptunicella plasticusilytica TaxID=3117012 RepID=UPI003A4E0CF8
MKSIVVLISGNGSNLQAIIDQCATNKIAGKITAVISNKPGAYGLQRAEQANIPAHVVDNRDYAERADYDTALMECIDQYQPDLVVLAGFMRILTSDFVEHYHGKMLNIHPSLLPKYKGLHTHQRAIEAGDTEHGASVHFVTPDLDGGPVIIQSRVPVFAEDDADELAQRVQQQERNIYPLVVSWFCAERLMMDQDKVIMDSIPLGSNGYAAD